MQDKMVKWYKDSLSKYGEGDFRSLTWSDEEGKSAKKRYQQMSEYVDFENLDVYEIGCGWGSFFDFGFRCKGYHGVDIVEEFIEIANKKYGNNPTVKFNNSNFYETDGLFDVAIASGVAGNQGGPASHPTGLYRFLQHMHKRAKVVMVNFPSVYATIRSKNIEYFAPSYLLTTALQITTDVQLIHKDMSDILLVMR